MSDKLTRWLIFGVGIALIPLLFSLMNMVTKGKFEGIETVVDNGELLLIAATISAGAVGELIGAGTHRSRAKLCAGGGCVATLMLSSLYFASISVAHNTSQTVDKEIVAIVSAVLFVCGVITSGSCIAMSESG